MKIFNILICLYIVLTLVFFNVIFDNGTFFNVSPSIKFFLNDNIYHFLLFFTICVTCIYYLLKNKVSIYFIWGLFFIFCNIFLELNNSIVDYGYFGFILLTFGTVSRIDVSLIKKIIKTSYFLFSVFFFLNILKYFIPYLEPPITLIRTDELFAFSGEFRFITPNLFIQSNAAGSFFAMLFIFITLKKYIFSKIEYVLLWILSLVFVISSASFTSIIVSLFIVLYLIIKYISNVFLNSVLIFFVLFFLFFYIDYSFLYSTSIFFKLNVFTEYLKLIIISPKYLIFGHNLFFTNGSVPIYTESSLLDFHANFGLIGVFFLFQLLFSIFWFNRGNNPLLYFYSTILLLTILFAQNSSLLPGNILLFMLIKLNYK